MAIRERVLRYLRDHPEGADDEELARALGLRRKQQATAICRALADEGAIRREASEGRARNLLSASPSPDDDGDTPGEAATVPAGRYDRSWAWEGNVREAAARFLIAEGWVLDEPGDGPSGEPATVLGARNVDGRPLLAAVRGLPPESARNRPAQARQYFAAAFLDLVLWRGRQTEAALILTLPDFITYRQLVEAAEWLLPELRVTVLWVHAGGDVRAVVYGEA